MSYLNSYVRELEDGKVTNRFRVFFLQAIFFSIASTPLFVLFPVAPLALTLSYYLTYIGLGLVNFMASLFHANLMHRNAGRINKIKKLPFDLHNSQYIEKFIFFIANNASYAISALYVATLISMGFYGETLYVIAAIGMLCVDQCFQRGLFPKFLEKAYFFLTTILLIAGGFGLDTWYGIALAGLNVAYFFWDYFQTHVEGNRSSNSQFPIATPGHGLSVKESIKDTSTYDNAAQLKNILNSLKNCQIRITFNHFQKADVITRQLNEDAPILTHEEANEFETLFLELDFKSPELRDTILCQMLDHDDFNLKSMNEHTNEFKLPKDADQVDIYIAYLKTRIYTMVGKLITPDYKGLNTDQIASLYGNTRMLLTFLKNNATPRDRENILLSLAIDTGDQCKRKYLDTFVKLNQQFNHSAWKSLPLNDRAALAAQRVRQREFNKYYFEFAPYAKYLDPVRIFTWEDLNEYHTQESFALNYGAYFYLMNTSLSARARDLSDICDEKLDFYTLSMLSDAFKINTLFSQYYTEDMFVHEVLSGEHLSSLFKEWCETLCPGIYNDLVLDEYQMIKTKDSQVQALAKLMLIDLEIAELNEPYIPKPDISNRSIFLHTTNMQHQLSLRFFTKTMDVPRLDISNNQGKLMM